VIGLPVAFLVVTVAVHLVGGVSFGEITREPSVTLDGPPLTGVQSNLGVLILWTGAVVSLSAYAILRATPKPHAAVDFHLWAGLITGYLAMDDLLLLHDDIFVDVLGQSEVRTMVVYALVIGAFLLRYRRSILSSRSVSLLGVAALLLAASFVIDRLADLWADQELRLFTEDALKLVGITSWTAYFIRRGYYAVAMFVAAPAATPDVAPRSG
jgi:hypothetical protein